MEMSKQVENQICSSCMGALAADVQLPDTYQ